MLHLPSEMVALLAAFAPLFSQPVFMHVPVLVVGAILTPGKRTVTAALRAVGLDQEAHFQNYHRVLNRDRWSPRHAARILLGLLVRAFVPHGPVIIGLDETLERRRGDHIAAKGIYRDAVRSSASFFVKASGLRWVVMMLLVPLPWARRVWALPFFTVLAPSERYHQDRGPRHKTLPDWGRQMILQVRRWLPQRHLVFVADSTYAVLALLDRCRSLPGRVCMITRLRLDAALYAPAPPRRPGQTGRPRKKGARLPTLLQRLTDPATVWTRVTVSDWYHQGPQEVEIASDTAVWYHSGEPPVPHRWVLIRDPAGKLDPQALLCTDLTVTPLQILTWFMLRWQVEVTFQEVREHLGVETQRQWNDLAIQRTTPALLGLYSLVTWLTQAWIGAEPPIRQAAWYVKEYLTFGDALALVRRKLWPHAHFCTSPETPDMQKLPPALVERLTELLCYAN